MSIKIISYADWWFSILSIISSKMNILGQAKVVYKEYHKI